MKNRLLLPLIAALISVPGVRAEGTPPAPAAAPAPSAVQPVAKPEKPQTELEKTMSKMNKAWRQVRKANRDDKLSPATAELVATVRTNAEAGAKLTPAFEADQPAADRAKFQADFETQMKKLIETLGQLETALKANDTATASKLIDDVGDLMKHGHHEFRKPEKH